jgi:hypothetical protein
MPTRSIFRLLAGGLSGATLSVLVACSSAPTEGGTGTSADAVDVRCPIWEEAGGDCQVVGHVYACACVEKPLSLATTAPDPSATDDQCQLWETDVAVPSDLEPLGCTLGVIYHDSPGDPRPGLHVFACSKFIQTSFDFPLPPYVSQCVGQPDPGFVMVGWYRNQINQAGNGPCTFPDP